MQLKHILIAQAVFFTGIFLYWITGSNNGRAVPPNELALVVSRTSFTQTQAGSGAASNLAPETIVKNPEMEIYHGQRIPISKALNPAWYAFPFYLGVQDYEFSGRPSYESESEDPVSISTAGDNVNFDINVQLEIDMSIPHDQLAIRLFRFIQSEKLASVSGENNLLSYWAKNRLKQVIERIFRNNLAQKQVLDVIRSKKEMNDQLLAALNEYVLGYGLHFRSAAITSAMHLPQSLKGNMLNAVRLEYAALANEQRKEKLVPLITQLQKLEMDGNQQIQDEQNRGEKESMVLIGKAYEDRRTILVNILGKENYGAFEQMHLLRTNLTTSGKTRIVVAPANMQVLTGLNDLPMPTAKALSADDFIKTTGIDEHGVSDRGVK